jgi:predicted MFS family arabinose efflux permease
VTARAEASATRAAFLVPGFVVATWAPIVPFAKARTGLDDAMLGLVLLCLGLGSLLAMPAAGVLAARYGCRAVMLVTALAMSLVLPLLAMVPEAWMLGAALFAFGAAIGAMDCTMNIQAVLVERDAARPLMSGFHAFYSIGSLAGALCATLLLTLAVPALAMTCVVALAMSLVALRAAPAWRGERAVPGAPLLALPRGVVAVVGAVCFVAFLAEGSMLDWSAVFLHEVRGVDASRAGWGFVAFNLAMTLARLAGDRTVARLGRARAVLAGGLLGGAGLAIATLVPGFAAALAGYALLGVGCANIVPVMFTLAGAQTRMPTALAIPAVTTMGYAGVLLGPALIGFVADASSLAAAFLLVGGMLALAAVVGAAIRTPAA